MHSRPIQLAECNDAVIGKPFVGRRIDTGRSDIDVHSLGPSGSAYGHALYDVALVFQRTRATPGTYTVITGKGIGATGDDQHHGTGIHLLLRGTGKFRVVTGCDPNAVSEVSNMLMWSAGEIPQYSASKRVICSLSCAPTLPRGENRCTRLRYTDPAVQTGRLPATMYTPCRCANVRCRPISG